MFRHLYNKVANVVSDAVNTVEIIYIQRPSQSVQVENPSFPREFCNSQCNEVSRMSHQASCSQNPPNLASGIRGTASRCSLLVVLSARNPGSISGVRRSLSEDNGSWSYPILRYELMFLEDSVASARIPEPHCPITCDLFRDPVIAEDGHTYEREAIVEWINRDGTSPITRQPLSVTGLRPNYTVRRICEEFRSMRINSDFTAPPYTHSPPTVCVQPSCPTQGSRPNLRNRSSGFPERTAHRPSRRVNQRANDLSSLSSATNGTVQGNNNSNRRRRIALLFGNDRYQYQEQLSCCARDVGGMSIALSSLGFKCNLIRDAGKQKMNKQLERFTQNVQSNDCVLVFFSGHGAEKNGILYLVPIDASSSNKSIENECIKVTDIIRALERCAENLFIIIICDSCRYEEYNSTFKATAKSFPIDDDLKSFPKSTIRLQTSSQILIFFSCDPGTVAFGNDTANGYSALTGALLNHIATPNIPIGQMLIRVTDEVMKNHNKRQRPWTHSTLREDFYFQ